jgi:cytochrome c2
MVNIAALFVTRAATFAARRSFCGVRQEQPGSHHHPLEAGDGGARFLAICGLLAGLGVMACACNRRETSTAAIGDAGRGKLLVQRLGCGSCHQIPRLAGADGRVGPPLGGVGGRTIIAGVLPNTPDNMAAWLKNPQAVVPNNAMPNMEIDDHDARDIAAYLYTLR